MVAKQYLKGLRLARNKFFFATSLCFFPTVFVSSRTNSGLGRNVWSLVTGILMLMFRTLWLRKSKRKKVCVQISHNLLKKINSKLQTDTSTLKHFHKFPRSQKTRAHTSTNDIFLRWDWYQDNIFYFFYFIWRRGGNVFFFLRRWFMLVGLLHNSWNCQGWVLLCLGILSRCGNSLVVAECTGSNFYRVFMRVRLFAVNWRHHWVWKALVRVQLFNRTKTKTSRQISMHSNCSELWPHSVKLAKH